VPLVTPAVTRRGNACEGAFPTKGFIVINKIFVVLTLAAGVVGQSYAKRGHRDHR
jgi:hypothetical protein